MAPYEGGDLALKRFVDKPYKRVMAPYEGGEFSFLICP
jgi:hypothetical protein